MSPMEATTNFRPRRLISRSILISLEVKLVTSRDLTSSHHHMIRSSKEDPLKRRRAAVATSLSRNVKAAAGRRERKFLRRTRCAYET